jgi:hypothetical protein
MRGRDPQSTPAFVVCKSWLRSRPVLLTPQMLKWTCKAQAIEPISASPLMSVCPILLPGHSVLGQSVGCVESGFWGFRYRPAKMTPQ